MLGAGKLRAHASLTTTPGARATKGLSGREGYSASERVQLLFKKLVLGDKEPGGLKSFRWNSVRHGKENQADS